MSEPLLQIADAVALYDTLSDSINTIWNNYVFVLLGIVGWTLARANEFRQVQKILITIIFGLFNAVILFYFHDAYTDMSALRADLAALQSAQELSVTAGGFSERLIATNPFDRFWFVLGVVGFIWAFVTYLVWAKKLWHVGGTSDRLLAKANSLPSPTSR